jgi:hypothetical protein
MFLNNPVRDRKPQARALARGLGGEERIVDAVQMLRGDAVPVSATSIRAPAPPPTRLHFQHPAAGSMASRAFRNRFRNTCCSLPALP